MAEIPRPTPKANHLGCIKLCKSWDKLPTSTGACRISAPSTASSRDSRHINWVQPPRILCLPRSCIPGKGELPNYIRTFIYLATWLKNLILVITFFEPLAADLQCNHYLACLIWKHQIKNIYICIVLQIGVRHLPQWSTRCCDLRWNFMDSDLPFSITKNTLQLFCQPKKNMGKRAWNANQKLWTYSHSLQWANNGDILLGNS